MEVCRGQVTSWDDNEIVAWEVRPTSRSDEREARSCSGRRPEFRARTGSGPPRVFLQPPGSSSAGPLTPTAVPPSSPRPAPLRRLRPPSQQLPQAKAKGEAPTSPSRPRRPRPLGPPRPARPDDPRPSPRCRSNPYPLATTPRAHSESTPHPSGCSKCISRASVGPAGIPAKNPARADFLPLPLLHASPHLLRRPWFWKRPLWGPLSLEGHLAIWSDQGVWCVYICPQLFRYHSLERQDPHPTSNLGVQLFLSDCPELQAAPPQSCLSVQSSSSMAAAGTVGTSFQTQQAGWTLKGPKHLGSDSRSGFPLYRRVLVSSLGHLRRGCEESLAPRGGVVESSNTRCLCQTYLWHRTARTGRKRFSF